MSYTNKQLKINNTCTKCLGCETRMCELIQIMGYKETLTTRTETFSSVGKNAHGWLEIGCVSEEMHRPLWPSQWCHSIFDTENDEDVNNNIAFNTLSCIFPLLLLAKLYTHEKHINLWEISTQKHIHVKPRSRILVIVQIVLILLFLDWVTTFRGILSDTGKFNNLTNCLYIMLKTELSYGS